MVGAERAGKQTSPRCTLCNERIVQGTLKEHSKTCYVRSPSVAEAEAMRLLATPTKEQAVGSARRTRPPSSSSSHYTAAVSAMGSSSISRSRSSGVGAVSAASTGGGTSAKRRVLEAGSGEVDSTSPLDAAAEAAAVAADPARRAARRLQRLGRLLHDMRSAIREVSAEDGEDGADATAAAEQQQRSHPSVLTASNHLFKLLQQLMSVFEGGDGTAMAPSPVPYPATTGVSGRTSGRRSTTPMDMPVRNSSAASQAAATGDGGVDGGGGGGHGGLLPPSPATRLGSVASFYGQSGIPFSFDNRGGIGGATPSAAAHRGAGGRGATPVRSAARRGVASGRTPQRRAGHEVAKLRRSSSFSGGSPSQSVVRDHTIIAAQAR